MIFEFWVFFLESTINTSIPKIIDWVLRLFSTSVMHNESIFKILINDYIYYF
jgi:hypothetical protein